MTLERPRRRHLGEVVHLVFLPRSLSSRPLAAAAGVAMPLMNGDDEEFLSSNCEKLAAIPKINTKIDLEDFAVQVRKLGCSFSNRNEEISPVEEFNEIPAGKPTAEKLTALGKTLIR